MNFLNRLQLKPFSFLAYLFSFVFHPLFIPLYTIVLYFYLSPRFFLEKNIRFLEMYLLIISILIPMLFFITMRAGGYFKSFFLDTTKERLFFSWIMLVVYLIILNKIVKFHIFIELVPFFLGISFALIWMSIANYLHYKPSLHAMGIGGMLAFFMIWSFYTKVFILPVIGLLLILGSLTLASRIYLEAHTYKELFYGFLIGFFSQVTAFILSYFFL